MSLRTWSAVEAARAARAATRALRRGGGALRRLPASAQVLLNADDPLVASLGQGLSCQVRFFGLEAPEVALAELQHAADSLDCPKCGRQLTFDQVYYGHVGHYHCEGCGWTRPDPDFAASDVRLSAEG